MKFKSNIEVQAGLEDASGSPGTVNQLLSSTVTGTAWIDPSTIVAEAASLVIIACKNTSGAAIPKGTPVYQTGNVGATATIEIAPADALISANKLPAIGVLQTDLNNNGFGNVVITGELTNFTTSPIDGVVPTTGDKIFVKSGGGLTLTKPTGEGNGIQNMGLVGKVSSGNSGSITVSSIMRTNDVPNLPEGRIWIGDGNTIVSDTVYVDEPNNRVGIGTTSPSYKLTSYSSGDEFAIVAGAGNAVGEFTGIGLSGYIATNAAVKAGLVFERETSWGIGKMHFLNNNTLGDSDATLSDSKMTIDSDGNVGIGTNSPGEKLDVAGDIRTSSNFIADNATLGSLSLRISGTETGRLDNFNSALRLINFHASSETIVQGNGDVSLNSVGSSNIKLSTANTERMRIDATGNVGIGTTSPNGKLSFENSVETRKIVLYEGGNNDFQFYGFGIEANKLIYTTAANTDDHVFYSGASATTRNELMRIEGGGNVGIGTASPSASHKLDVNGAGRFSGNVTSTGNISARSFDMNSTYESSNQYLQLHKNQANDGGILLRSKTAAGAGQVDWQIVNQGTTGDLKFYAYGLGGNAFVLDRETGNLQLPEYGAGTLISDASGNISVSSGGGAGGPYLPLAGGTMTGTNGVLFPDNFKLNLGAGSDLQIYHDGSNSYINDTDTGDLYIQAGDNMYFQTYGTGKRWITLTENAGVDLFYNDTKRLATTNTGVTVTGDIKIDSALLSNQENTDVDTGTETVANVAIATYTAAFFDFVIKKTTNVRSGTVYACHDGTNVEFTETSTNDLGDTSDVTLSVDISGTNMRLLATVTSDDWSVKSLIRAI